jgi:hypothetical protein
MEAKNLAIVFAPTLLRPTGNDPLTTLNDATKSQRIIELLILNYDDLFVVRLTCMPFAALAECFLSRRRP